MSDGLLAGKVAFVSGGSRGIGAGIVRRLAHDGAAVALTYSSSPDKAAEVVRAIEAEGGRALAIQADSADAAAVTAAIQQAAQHFGRLDILVNNAGIAIQKPIDDFTLDEFDRMIAVNVRAVFVAAQEAARHMTDGGRIITIGSCNGDRMGFPNSAVYAMTKSAVAGFARGLAHDLGPRGITVNTVQPGPTDTDMNPAGGPNGDFLRSILPLRRFGRVEEIAGMVAYLAGPDAGFITGASLEIDGGFNA